MVFGIDFDNTIATHNYPYVGELIPMAKEVINTLADNGHTIMLWTVRGNEYWDSEGKINALQNAREFLDDNEIEVHYFNESPIHPSSSPKQLVDFFIDDISDISIMDKDILITCFAERSNHTHSSLNLRH